MGAVVVAVALVVVTACCCCLCAAGASQPHNSVADTAATHSKKDA